jgi:purine-binding chemotaxis protein CheW
VKERSNIDWQAARQLIERTRLSLERPQVSVEERTRIFRQRAEALARPAAAAPDSAQQLQIMIFLLGKERFALPLSNVVEVIAGAAICPAPGAPAAVAGVIQVRGEIRPVFHLAQLLGAVSTAPVHTVVLVRHGNREVGLGVNRVEDIRSVGAEDFREAPAGNPRIERLTADLIPVPDLDFLLGESREAASS